MKREKIGIILMIIFVLAGCAREYGITDPDGTYLKMTLQFPESGISERSRLIHSQSDELKIKLTYPDGSFYEAEFTRNEESVMTVQVEDLDVAAGVVIDVTMGIAAYDLVLTKASQTKDIAEGANSASLTLEAYDLTVSGTLVNGSDQPIPNNTFTVDGANVTTDDGGNFTLSVNTENLDDLKMIRVVNGDTFDFVRTHLALLQDWDDFTLKTAPEIYLDFMVECAQYTLPGAAWSVLEGGVTEVASGTADALGQVVFQTNPGLTGTGSYEIQCSYNDMFITEIVTTPGAPGAYFDTITLEPYIVFPHFYQNAGTNNIIRMEDMTGTGLEAITLVPIIDSVTGTTSQRFVNTVVDYLRGKIFLYGVYDSYPNYKHGIFIFDSWSDTTPTLINITDAITVAPYGTAIFGVPQMTVLDNGNLLVATSYGTVLCDVTTASVSSVWDTDNDFAFVSSGVYEADDGTLYALGVDRSTLTGDPDVQSIWRLDAGGGLPTQVATIPTAYDDFITRQAGLTDVYLYSSTFQYSLGLYEWNSGIVTLDVQDNTGSQTGGSIVLLNAVGSAWTLNGSPITQSPDSDPLDYIIPIGILPDNKFYFIEEFAYDKNYLIRMDDPGTSPTEAYEYLSDGSGELQYYYYYYEPSSASL